MYQIDTSTGYSLPVFEQTDYVGQTQSPQINGV